MRAHNDSLSETDYSNPSLASSLAESVRLEFEYSPRRVFVGFAGSVAAGFSFFSGFDSACEVSVGLERERRRDRLRHDRSTQPTHLRHSNDP